MSAELILQNMLNNTDDKFDKSQGSFLYDSQKSVAIEINEVNEKASDVLAKLDVENLTGLDLERHVYQRTGIERRPATFASGTVVITASTNTLLNAGDLVAADDVFYEVINTSNLTAGNHIVQVKCTQNGSVGNVPVGAINSFPVTLNNIVSVTNSAIFNNGYDEESDASLRQRYYDRLQRPGKSGNPDHYREWASEISGVGKVKVLPRWQGPLTVKVAILDVNNDFAPVELINNVYNHIVSEMPIGPDVTVVTATGLTIDISASFVIKNGYTWLDVEVKIINKLNAYFNGIAFEEGLTYLSYAQIGREILSVEGIEDYSNLLVNGAAENVALDETEKAIVGSVTNAHEYT